jgi:cellulose synthase/poly-beta-1,6-N-acetylglucosamine synthase-like glycosyltransferase
MSTVLEVLFWASVGLILYTHAGYPLLLWTIARLGRTRAERSDGHGLPHVSLIVAAYDEEQVIAGKLHNALALDYPRELLELIVASDGSSDRTAEIARQAGADVVLELPRGGKIRTQDAGVEAASGAIVAFSDANSTLAPDALRRLMAPFADPRVGYVCGQVRFTRADGTNEEGAYWRYEMAVRSLESRLGGVTGGNGALYATRRDAYLVVDPRMGHDLSFPFNMVKRGWRAIYEPAARAEEKMVPSIEGEFRRKRRMMSHTWPIVLRGGMLSPRGYGPLYALQIGSHRVLRYLTPFLHLVALGANLLLLGHGWVYAVTLAAQLALLLAAALATVVPARPLRLALYYVLVTASPAAGLWDWLRSGTPAGWEKAEGTR